MKKFLKKNSKLVYIISPALVIFIFAGMSFSNIFNRELGMSLILFSLLIVNPVIFLLIGFYSQKKNINYFIFSFPSFFSFLLLFLIWLNSSALGYFFLYFSASMVGIAIYKFNMKIDEKNVRKSMENKFYNKRK